MLKVIDNIIPYKQQKSTINPYSENARTKRLINKKRFLIKRWKKYRRLPDKINANKLNLEIRNALYETKKNCVRKKIQPGNSKSLWDATKIAMDKECTDIPDKVHHGQNVYENEDIPEAFANYFMDKVNNIAQSTTLDEWNQNNACR